MSEDQLRIASELLYFYGYFESIEDYETCSKIWGVYLLILKKYEITSVDVFNYYKEHKDD